MRREDIELIAAVGEGSFSTVWKAKLTSTEEIVAVKRIHQSKIDDDSLKLLTQEADTLMAMQHSRLVTGRGAFVAAVDDAPNEEELFLVMEFVDGKDLLYLFQKQGKMTEQRAFHFFSQIVDGIDYMHAAGFVHRDLKLENIFVTQDENIKIGDYGFSSPWSPETKLTDELGSLQYTSPEVINKIPYYGPEVDLWAMGVILYALTCGTLPFNGGGASDKHQAALKSKIIKGCPALPAFISSELRILLRGLLNPSVDQRFSIQQIRNSSWYNKILQPDEVVTFPRAASVTMLPRAQPKLFSTASSPGLVTSSPVPRVSVVAPARPRSPPVSSATPSPAACSTPGLCRDSQKSTTPSVNRVPTPTPPEFQHPMMAPRGPGRPALMHQNPSSRILFARAQSSS